ncbi:MAG TPA: hypothetical protein PKV72_01135 [Candidatus Peribacteria bacterium]|nr:hypothetical protein [Candidatus Peribacteria bacterium]
MNAILFLALAMTPSADPKVEYVDEGFQYPVVTFVTKNDGKAVTDNTVRGIAKDKAPGFSIKPGEYTFLTRNTTSGFPQPIEYVLKNAKGETTWESGVTVDHKQVKLAADETLEIRVQKPFVSYNSQKIRLPGISTPVMLIGARPYWFYFADKGEFPLDAPEQYPNGIFFLCDPKWGVEGVAKDLAEKVYADMQKKGENTNDHRGKCHWSVLHGVTPDGKVPDELRAVQKGEWEKAIHASFDSMLARNYYRPFEVQTVRQLKAGDWLPKETPDRPLVITLGQGVEYGKLYRERWLKLRAEETKKKD